MGVTVKAYLQKYMTAATQCLGLDKKVTTSLMVMGIECDTEVPLVFPVFFSR